MLTQQSWGTRGQNTDLSLINSHFLCMQAAMTLTRLLQCAGSSGPWPLADVILKYINHIHSYRLKIQDLTRHTLPTMGPGIHSVIDNRFRTRLGIPCPLYQSLHLLPVSCWHHYHHPLLHMSVFLCVSSVALQSLLSESVNTGIRPHMDIGRQAQQTHVHKTEDIPK